MIRTNHAATLVSGRIPTVTKVAATLASGKIPTVTKVGGIHASGEEIRTVTRAGDLRPEVTEEEAIQPA